MKLFKEIIFPLFLGSECTTSVIVRMDEVLGTHMM
jgi:hypothetical protein